MSVSALNSVAGIPSTAASLGVTSQPRTTGSTGNARVATGYSATPSAAASTAPVSGGTSNSLAVAVNRAAATTGASVADVRAATNEVSNQFGASTASDLATATGGGPITDALKSGVARIAAFAQNGIKSIEQAIQGEMSASGQIDPARMQQYTMQMSTFEMIMQMAAKIQEKQERAAQVWLNL